MHPERISKHFQSLDPFWPEQAEAATTSSTVSGVHLTSRIMPALLGDRGGDWCESFPVSEHVVALSIGDMSGHGPGKHPLMVETRATIRHAARAGLDPQSVLAAANQCILGRAVYATAIFGLLDTQRHTFAFANAGHPAPLVAGPFGTMFLEYEGADLMLGVAHPWFPTLRQVDVPASTLLVLYTDGVSERDHKPLDGAARIQDATINAYGYAAHLTASVIGEELELGGSNADDAAILTAWTPHARWPERDRRTLYR